MKYVEVAVPASDSKDLLDYIQLQGKMELKEPEEIDGLSTLATAKSVVQMERYLDTAQTALNILDRYVPEKKGLLSAFDDLPEMTVTEYISRCDQADEILSVCREICDSEKTVADSKAAVAKLEAARESIYPWINLDVPMQYKGTETTKAYIGTLAGDYTSESLAVSMAELLAEENRYECEVISHSRDRSCIFAVCHKECSEAVLSALRSLGFAFPSDPTKHEPRVRYERLAGEIEKWEKEKTEAEEKIRSLEGSREDIKFVCDYFLSRRDRYESLQKVLAGDSVVILTGYVPENEADEFVGKLSDKFDVAVSVTDTNDDDDAPVMFKNKPFAAAVEPVTEMYSMPGKDDIDPNPVMSFFYYMLFGIMLSDAGYGLLMAIGCGIAKFKFKPKGKLKKTVDMYYWCGLATVFWGALFGSWFGDIIPRVASQFFGVADLGVRLNSMMGIPLFREALINPNNPGSVALWFEPVNNPTKLLLFSFLFGIVHLFFGVAASMVKMWKVGNKVGAICDGIPVFLLITGIAPIGANIIKAETFSASVTSVAKWIALAGVILIVATSGRSSKNIVGKLGLGLYGLYNAASGWLSDILSYSRLLALGLCTGVIATVINILGTIPDDKTTKLILLIPVFIFGHLVNMAINLIGTYVHTNRLQYVEFFAKFYDGGGRSFTPLKNNNKYFNVREDN